MCARMCACVHVFTAQGPKQLPLRRHTGPWMRLTSWPPPLPHAPGTRAGGVPSEQPLQGTAEERGPWGSTTGGRGSPASVSAGQSPGLGSGPQAAGRVLGAPGPNTSSLIPGPAFLARGLESHLCDSWVLLWGGGVNTGRSVFTSRHGVPAPPLRYWPGAWRLGPPASPSLSFTICKMGLQFLPQGWGVNTRQPKLPRAPGSPAPVPVLFYGGHPRRWALPTVPFYRGAN